MEITDTTDIEEAQGYEHGMFDISVDAFPLATTDPRSWDSASAAYRSGYEAGYEDGKVSIG